MKFVDLVTCIEIIKNTCQASGFTYDNGEFSLLNFQRGANAPLEQKLRLVIDFCDCEVAVEVAPKYSGDKEK